MFPVYSCVRLIALFFIALIAVYTAVYALWSLVFLSHVEHEVLAEVVQVRSALYNQDTVKTLKSRLNREWYYRRKLAGMSGEEIRKFSELYHRDIAIQWGERPLLPPSKPLFDIMCFDYIDSSYDFSISIVITYYNELSMLLMRLLTTIKHRTPSQYLREIILINDNSRINITNEITEYARDQDIPLVYLHNKERLGIADSRRKGVMVSAGDIIVLLDSHMEVNDGWMEPLLHSLTLKPRALAVPLIHMSDETKYTQHSYTVVSPYYIRMQKGFGVFDFQETQGSVNGRKWEMYPSSSLLGGAIAGRRELLQELYPAGVEPGGSWGFENNRLAFRAWLCGEGIWMCPCSQIFHPNGADGTLLRYLPNAAEFNALMGNSVAEAVNFMREKTDKEKCISKYTSDPSLSSIVRQKSELIRKIFNPELHKCKDYKSYYLKHVFENYLSWESDEFVLVGEIQSVEIAELCLEMLDSKLTPYTCRTRLPVAMDSHTMGFTRNHNIRLGNKENNCWDAAGHGDRTQVISYPCHLKDATQGSALDTQWFEYRDDTQQIVHVPTDRCLKIADVSTVWLVKCDVSDGKQKWTIKKCAWF